METIVQLESVKEFFPVGGSLTLRPSGRKQVRAVDDVSMVLLEGETIGIVGESGSGKTTLGRLIMRLIEPTSGRILFKGTDISNLKRGELKQFRRNMQMIFQNPNASLSSHMTIGEAIRRPARIHLRMVRNEESQKVLETLEHVGLTPALKYVNRYPHELSGGERQRAVIARALILNPEIIIADEPVAMLDVSVRAQIIELLLELKRSLGLTYVLITHDLSVAGYLCDRIAVMYLGRIVETGTTDEIFRNPQHPYTAALLATVPSANPEKRRLKPAALGEIPNPIDRPSGCHFHPRCKYAVESCRQSEPEEVFSSKTHSARCPVRPFAIQVERLRE